MKQNFYFLLLFTCSWAVKEELGGIDVDTLLNDPDALFNLEKRIGKMLADLDTEGQHNTNTDCNALKGVLNNGCEFHANKSSIIRTKESLAKNAKFLEDLSNVSCARDCTALCCDHEECDTAVYQDKDVHNCYLFKCGSPSMCVFAEHADYWMSSISKDVHNSHSHTPGMATVIHESELQDLGSDSLEQDVAPPVPPSTTVKTTTQKPGLGEHCASYSTKCNDSHAECLMGSCTCRVGYHEKHGICRKHCRDEEFECENVVPGVASRQCVHKSYMCDGSQDCADGSDEYRCPEKDKPAYLDVDSAGNLYNNPLYNLPYGSQQDPQYPYGFPIPGLTNQKQAGLLPANQIYPSQLQPQPSNAGGSFYLPVQGQTGSQAGSQLNGQWPYYDKSLGSPLYQNGLPYQTGQQTAYIPPQQQQPSQAGYIPVAQQPVNTVQQVKTNVQPVQPVVNSQSAGTQYAPANTGLVPVMPKENTGIQPPAQQPPVKQQPAVIVPQQSQNTVPDQTKQVKQAMPAVQNSAPDKSRYPTDTYDESYQDYTGTDKQIGGNTVAQKSHDLDSDVNDLPGGNDYGNYYPKGFHTNENHRHSEQEENYNHRPAQVPVTTKPAEQTTLVVRNKANKDKQNSEGYLDYSSWIGYDSNSPRINGKKGPAHKTASKETKKTTRKPPTTVTQSKGYSVQQGTHKSTNDQPGRGTGNRYNTDDRDYNRYPTDTYRGRFDDFDRPTGARRPGYDRYPDRYNSGNRHRPSHGSRYPFYESGYPRGRDRNPYPVWDPMKAEYYYPEDYEDDKDLEAVPGMDSMGAGRGMDYLDVPTDDRVPNQRPHKTDIPVPKVHTHNDDILGPKVHTQDEDTAPTPRPVKIESPPEPVPTTQAPPVSEKVNPQEPKPTPSIPESPKQSPKTGSDSQEANDSDEQAPQSSNDSDESDSTDGKTQENQSTDTQSKGNSSGTQSGVGGSGQFRFLNVESVEVDSYTDNSQGPIVALSLGLAITVVLLIFVGCRLRTVKRRLRKGRALHSNEADYLINGMYL